MRFERVVIGKLFFRGSKKASEIFWTTIETAHVLGHRVAVELVYESEFPLRLEASTVIIHATEKGTEQKDPKEELPRVSPRQDVPANSQEVRESQGDEANDRRRFTDGGRVQAPKKDSRSEEKAVDLIAQLNQLYGELPIPFYIRRDQHGE